MTENLLESATDSMTRMELEIKNLERLMRRAGAYEKIVLLRRRTNLLVNYARLTRMVIRLKQEALYAA